MDHDYYDFIDDQAPVFGESVSPTLEKEGTNKSGLKVNLKNTYIKKISNLLH